MIEAMWPCADSKIKKGRWKVSRCNNANIKIHAECIFLEVFGHPLHNANCPLYFAMMLYVQFVQNSLVDFASKEVTVITHNICEEIVTFTREELAFMVEGAGLELNKVKETLEAKLVELCLHFCIVGWRRLRLAQPNCHLLFLSKLGIEGFFNLVEL